jgi:SAM-dependent methyltransferase
MGIRERLHHRFHEARADLFARLMKPARGMRLLDLGGGDGSLAARIARRLELEVTVADIAEDHVDAVRAQGFEHVLLPESGILPFAEASFDLVLCNSVIEHATLPKESCLVTARVPELVWKAGARSGQARLAAEIKRVGRGWFVQTPDRRFPIDQHVHLPFVHYLSHNAACRMVSFTDRVWIKSCQGVVDWELFTPLELSGLFPEGRIHIERFAGLPKSIIVWKAA